MASEQPVEVEFTHRELTVWSDGSTQRAPFQPALIPACPSPPFPQQQVASKDLTLDPTLGTWARLFLPPSAEKKKLPILLYFHCGAFLICSTAQPMIHDFLCKLALHVQMLIVSIDYRLAPENPFPAAYDDGFHALIWLNQQAALGDLGEPWLASHGDLSRCFLAGDSAGANIVHNVAMQAAGQGCWNKAPQHEEAHLGDVCVQGMILVHPFFTCGLDLDSPLPVKDAHVLKYCKISAAHPLANPLSPTAPSLAAASLPPALVFVAGRDVLKERGVAYHQSLLEAGKQARLVLTHNEDHVFHLFNPASLNVVPLLDEVSNFVNPI